MSAVGGAGVSSLLAIDEDELFFRRAARRFRRATAPTTPTTPPGVLLLQIDGLGYDTVRRAVRDGDLPTFARWLADGSHVAHRLALRLELPDRRERVRHCCTAATTTSSASAGTRRTATT